MHCTSSLLAVALLTFSSVSPVFGTRPQIPEQWMRKQFDAEQDAAKKLAKRDYVCYDDGFLSQLQADPAVFSTFCSAYLTETDTATSTSDVTTTTTVSTIYTTVDQTYAGAATIPSSTVSVTVTAAGRHRKRQTAFVTGSISSTMLISATDPGAIMSTLSSCQQNPSPTGGQKSILNSYSSACSCFISPGIETILVSLTSTRTISGEDHAQYTETNTVTWGVTTVTVTAIPAPSSGPTIYTNASISATDSPIAGPTVPAGSLTPVSGSPTATTNSTTSTSSPSYPPLPNCPAQNGTTYTTQGQTFLILCGVNYAGPDNQGLIVPSLHQCIDDCALVNIAFSQDRCFGTSYDPTLGPGVQDCFFRTLPNSLLPIDNPNYISARLLSPLPPINGTNPTLPTGSGFMPSGSVYPTGSSISQNATSSVFPTLSINSSSFPSYSVSLTTTCN